MSESGNSRTPPGCVLDFDALVTKPISFSSRAVLPRVLSLGLLCVTRIRRAVNSNFEEQTRGWKHRRKKESRSSNLHPNWQKLLGPVKYLLVPKNLEHKASELVEIITEVLVQVLLQTTWPARLCLFCSWSLVTPNSKRKLLRLARK